MSVADLMKDPHCTARGSIVTVADEEFGDVPMVAPLPKMSATPGAVRWPGTELGAHTDEVLGGLLGMSEGELDTLREQGVV
jgi:crotonobetainyl-CoA:carnitine CoA-transferase CaiB-like acyl-CoA transferase